MPTQGNGKHSCASSPDSVRNAEPDPNRDGFELSVPIPTDKRSWVTGIILQEIDEPGPVHLKRICGVSPPVGATRTL